LLCDEVLSLPIHTEKNSKDIETVCSNVISFFKN
jgi:dTDP-4-amino-4,6-dideoxygalactose transaminase